MEEKEMFEVKEEEILQLAEMYRQMTPANRFFIVSASGLLLASQSIYRAGTGEGSRIGERCEK